MQPHKIHSRTPFLMLLLSIHNSCCNNSSPHRLNISTSTTSSTKLSTLREIMTTLTRSTSQVQRREQTLPEMKYRGTLTTGPWIQISKSLVMNHKRPPKKTVKGIFKDLWTKMRSQTLINKRVILISRLNIKRSNSTINLSINRTAFKIK